jgi:hypothetical protein
MSQTGTWSEVSLQKALQTGESARLADRTIERDGCAQNIQYVRGTRSVPIAQPLSTTDISSDLIFSVSEPMEVSE